MACHGYDWTWPFKLESCGLANLKPLRFMTIVRRLRISGTVELLVACSQAVCQRIGT